METNESILTRSIVGLDERKVLGKMSSLRVDYDTQAVSHYIVMNASTNNAIALPFENAIAVGDTFITVQSYGSFVDANSPASKELVSDSNKLVGVEVYSRTVAPHYERRLNLPRFVEGFGESAVQIR